MMMAIGTDISKGPSGEALQRAQVALHGQRADEAERIAAEILKSQPRQPQALHIFGCALLMQGRAKEAIPPLTEAARLRHSAEIDTQLAIALREAGRIDDAVSRLKRAIKREPPYPAAFHEFAFVLSSMKRYDEAVDVLQRGLAVAPMMPQLSIQLGHVMLARKDRAGAKIAFSRALAINPEHSEALLGMAMALLEDGNYAPAAEHLRAYLAGRPDNSGAWINLGHALLETGQRDAGLDCFRRAARLGEKNIGLAMQGLIKAGHGRFWLRPSAAARFFRDGGR